VFSEHDADYFADELDYMVGSPAAVGCHRGHRWLLGSSMDVSGTGWRHGIHA
jgi:hypothetical protein